MFKSNESMSHPNEEEKTIDSYWFWKQDLSSLSLCHNQNQLNESMAYQNYETYKELKVIAAQTNPEISKEEIMSNSWNLSGTKRWNIRIASNADSKYLTFADMKDETKNTHKIHRTCLAMSEFMKASNFLYAKCVKRASLKKEI